MSDNPQQAELHNILDDFQRQDWQFAATDPKLGSLNFEEGLPILSGVVSLARRLVNMDLSVVPRTKLDELIKVVLNIREFADEIRSFDLRRTNAPVRRMELIRNLRSEYDNLFDLAGTVLAFLSASEKDVRDMRGNVESLAQVAVSAELQRSGVAVSDLVKASEQAGAAVEAIRTAAAQAGVSTHARVFGEQAKEHCEPPITGR
jgi:hypothetical protein